MKETFVPQRDHFQVIDFFAGAARITKLARGLGLAAACLDKDLSGVFDLNTDAGFMLLAAVKHVSSVEAGPRTAPIRRHLEELYSGWHWSWYYKAKKTMWWQCLGFPATRSSEFRKAAQTDARSCQWVHQLLPRSTLPTNYCPGRSVTTNVLF